jgi:hypothetical protein
MSCGAILSGHFQVRDYAQQSVDEGSGARHTQDRLETECANARSGNSANVHQNDPADKNLRGARGGKGYVGDRSKVRASDKNRNLSLRRQRPVR